MKCIILILFFVALLTLQGCNKDIIGAKSFCNVTDPVQDLPWLKTIIDDQANNKYSKMTITKYEYQQDEGFLVDSCVNCPNSVAIFYNCNGNKICQFDGKNGSNTCPDFLAQSIRKEITFQDTIVENRPDTYFCRVDNPLEDLPWLKTIIGDQANNKYSKMTITKYEYQQEEGFLVDSCVNCPDSVAIFYNCNGHKICQFDGKNGSNTCPDFLTQSIRKEIAFQDTIVENRPDTYFCNVDNPLEDLPWLKRKIEGLKTHSGKAKIYRLTNDNIEGIFISECSGCPDALSYYYSCDGTVLYEFGGFDGRITCPNFSQKTTMKELILEIN